VPSRKQRRRQQKLRRHEYEEVWVDAEGNELPAEEAAQLETSVDGGSRKAADGHRDAPSVRRPTGKVVPPASWSRVLKRGLIFAPVMFLLITILPGGDRFSTAQKLVLTVQYMLMLIVFMYLTERLTHRIWRKRQGGVQAEKR